MNETKQRNYSVNEWREVFKAVEKMQYTSVEELRNDTTIQDPLTGMTLWEQFFTAVYDLIKNKGVKSNWEMLLNLSKFYTDTETLADDFLYNVVLDTMVKGKHKGNSWIETHLLSHSYTTWEPILMTAFRNYLKDQYKKTSWDSLDRTINSENDKKDLCLLDSLENVSLLGIPEDYIIERSFYDTISCSILELIEEENGHQMIPVLFNLACKDMECDSRKFEKERAEMVLDTILASKDPAQLVTASIRFLDSRTDLYELADKFLDVTPLIDLKQLERTYMIPVKLMNGMAKKAKNVYRNELRTLIEKDMAVGMARLLERCREKDPELFGYYPGYK